MSKLKEKLQEKIEAWRPRTTALLKKAGDVKLGDVTIGMALGGARGVKCLVTDISYLDPQEGIRFRGFTIPETLEKLPKVPGSDMPYVEGFLYLLLTGDLPTKADAEEVAAEFKARARVPRYVFDVLRAMPRDSHPMTMLSAAILCMQRDSVYVRRYNEGLGKNDHWDPTYEDALNLLARLPEIGAYIFRMKYRGRHPDRARPEAGLGRQLRAHDGRPQSPTTTCRASTSSCTATTRAATSAPTPGTWSRARSPTSTTRARR